VRYWRRKVQTLRMDEILEAVDDPKWQEFRLSLKGIPTHRKLIMLDEYLRTHTSDVDKIRVDNYINALLRGGQLKKICNELLMVAR